MLRFCASVPGPTVTRTTSGREVKKYMCLICGFIYDEAVGRPEEGIPAGTKWGDIPLAWRCPDCGSGKEDFEMVEV